MWSNAIAQTFTSSLYKKQLAQLTMIICKVSIQQSQCNVRAKRESWTPKADTTDQDFQTLKSLFNTKRSGIRAGH